MITETSSSIWREKRGLTDGVDGPSRRPCHRGEEKRRTRNRRMNCAHFEKETPRTDDFHGKKNTTKVARKIEIVAGRSRRGRTETGLLLRMLARLGNVC